MVWSVVEDVTTPWKLLDTIAVGDKYVLPNASGNTISFWPVRSQLRNVSDSITADVEGVYRITNTVTNHTISWHKT